MGEGVAGYHSQSSAFVPCMIPPGAQLLTVSKVFCKNIPFSPSSTNLPTTSVSRGLHRIPGVVGGEAPLMEGHD